MLNVTKIKIKTFQPILYTVVVAQFTERSLPTPEDISNFYREILFSVNSIGKTKMGKEAGNGPFNSDLEPDHRLGLFYLHRDNSIHIEIS